MSKRNDEQFAERLLTYTLWNELLIGQEKENIYRLIDSLSLDFPVSFLEGQYYLLVSGLERRMYRKFGSNAMSYEAEMNMLWHSMQERLFELGYEGVYFLQNYSEEKRLVFALKAVKTGAIKAYEAAEFISERIQKHYDAYYSGKNKEKNFSVLSIEMEGIKELPAKFKQLCCLHKCIFFQIEPYFITEESVEHLRVECEYSELLQMSRELPSLIMNGNEEDVFAHLENIFCKKLRYSYNVNLCYDTANAVIARLLEIDDAYQLNMSKELSSFVPQKCATFDILYGRLLEFVDRCVQGVRDSKRRYCAITRAAVTYIHHNYAKAFTLTELADSVNAAPSYVSRMFNRDVGESIPTYLTRIRIQNAARMLLETEKSVREIAQEVGFLGASYFSRIFKEEMGLTPKAYREQHGIGEGKED